MTNDKKYIEWYKKTYAPDEICYITNIFVNNLQNEIITVINNADEGTTFVNWEGLVYKFPSKGGLKTYNNISNEEITHLLNSKSLFGRKFTHKCIQTILSSDYEKLISS